MSLLLAGAAICLLHVALGVPAGCRDQIIPLELNGQTPVFGKWFFIAAASNYEGFIAMMKTGKSFWMELSRNPENNTVSLSSAASVNGTCEFSTATPEIANNTLKFDSGSSGIHLHGCPNCLIITFNRTEDEVTSQFLLLWGRNRTLSASDMKTYMRHVACLGLGPPVFMDPQQDLCPDERNASSKQASVELQVGPPSVPASASVSCKELLAPRHLGDLTPIFGKWFFLYETGDQSLVTKNYKSIPTEIDSMWMVLSPTPRDDTVLMSYAKMKHNECHVFASNRTIANNTLIFDHDRGRDELHLLTCPDCLIVQGKLNIQGKTVQSLQAWGRNRTLSVSDKYTYNRIIACLGLGQPVFMDPHKELCPVMKKL